MKQFIFLLSISIAISCSSDKSFNPDPVQTGLLGSWLLVEKCYLDSNGEATICNSKDSITDEIVMIFDEDSTLSISVNGQLENYGTFVVNKTLNSENDTIEYFTAENSIFIYNLIEKTDDYFVLVTTCDVCREFFGYVEGKYVRITKP